MPNRIIKESICTSETEDQMTWFEECFWHRLIVNCDDYGRFDARPAVLKARLFPLKECITLKEVSDTLAKLASVGAVVLYERDGKPYLYLPTWEVHQTIRAKRSKYPAPEDGVKSSEIICMQMQADASICSRNPIRIQSESESISESEYESKDAQARDVVDAFNRICTSLPKVKSLTPAREKAVRARSSPLETFETVFEAAEKSDFLSGRSGKWSGCGFDWLLKPTNWQKVLEGNYDRAGADKFDNLRRLRAEMEALDEQDRNN